MAAPEPMLASSGATWRAADGWISQPKWDGFRLLVAVGADGMVRAWSRHGTSLTGCLGDLLQPFAGTSSSSIFDGELVALSSRDGRPVQDFAMVCRAALRRDEDALRHLHFIAFDLLQLDGEDVRGLPWTRRSGLLTEAMPSAPRLRAVSNQPASVETYDATVDLGFEGVVLKRKDSLYRPGRQRTWRKHKARHRLAVELLDVRAARDGRCYAVCEAECGRITAIAPASATSLRGHEVEIVYSRIDADGSLREARLETRTASLSAS